MKLYELMKTSYTPQFKKWFGNSVVVNDDGSPKVVYHGTGSEFSKFIKTIWASEGTDLPNDYAMLKGLYNDKLSPNIIPLYMKIENPFDADKLTNTETVGTFINNMVEQFIDNGNTLTEAIRKYVLKLSEFIIHSARQEESGPYYSPYQFWYEPNSLFGIKGAKALLKLFKVMNFDGIIFTENNEKTYGTFNPKNVKSVFASVYDSSSDNISEFKMYHGSTNGHQRPTTQYRGNNSHTFGEYESSRNGVFFTDNPKFAEIYGEVEVYDIRSTKPLNLDSDKGRNIIYEFAYLTDEDGTYVNEDRHYIAEIAQYGRNIWQMFEDETGENFIKYLRSLDYDSATFEESHDDITSNTLVVFNPKDVEYKGQIEMDLYYTQHSAQNR